MNATSSCQDKILGELRYQIWNKKIFWQKLPKYINTNEHFLMSKGPFQVSTFWKRPGLTKLYIKMALKSDQTREHQVSISSTLNVRILRTNVLSYIVKAET